MCLRRILKVAKLKTKFYKKRPPKNPIGGISSAFETLKIGCEALDSLGWKYWLSAGTLLGIHRDDSFIYHDTDIDVEIIGPKDTQELVEGMSHFDLLVTRVNEDIGPIQTAFEDPANQAIFDVYTFYEDGSNLVSDFGLWYPKSYFKDLTTINFNGIDFPCPDPDWYCEFRYGKDWKTPKNKKGNWRKDCKIPKRKT